jgi:hypothetical protein
MRRYRHGPGAVPLWSPKPLSWLYRASSGTVSSQTDLCRPCPFISALRSLLDLGLRPRWQTSTRSLSNSRTFTTLRSTQTGQHWPLSTYAPSIVCLILSLTIINPFLRAIFLTSSAAGVHALLGGHANPRSIQHRGEDHCAPGHPITKEIVH